MAARQDQTLQIFLIIFIFAFLVCAVVAYLGWKGYSDSEQRAVALQNQLDDRTTQTQNQQTELEDLREWMGFGRNDNTTGVKTTFEEDMKRFGSGVGEEGRGYRDVLASIHAEWKQTAGREAKLKEDLKDRTERLDAVEGEKEAQIAKVEEARKKAEADAAAERNSFAQDRAELEKNKKELMAKVESQKTEFESKVAQRDARITDLEAKIGKLEHAVANLIEQRKDEPGSFQVADGRISWVNQSNGTVWINLGSADSLRRQVTFSVFDADQHDAAKATKKGSIEVTRLLGEHLAEARITDDSSTNPITPGDHVYSQVWHRGKKLRFALTGIIDLTGDGRSDMQLARELIELNGGVVDAYLTDDGKVEGEITAYTRYLVLGDFPELPTQVAMQDSWNRMNQEASSLGVQTIQIEEFLNQMGYKPQDRTVQLGSGASARDFPARPDDGAPPVNDRRFRSRTPTATPR